MSNPKSRVLVSCILFVTLPYNLDRVIWPCGFTVRGSPVKHNGTLDVGQALRDMVLDIPLKKHLIGYHSNLIR